MKRLLLSLVLLALPLSAIRAEELFPNKSGAELRKLIREQYAPTQGLGYRPLNDTAHGNLHSSWSS